MLLRSLCVPRRKRACPVLLPVTVCLLSSLSLCARSQTNVTVNTPTEAALNAAVAQMQARRGGTITFACDGVIPITSTKTFTLSNSSSVNIFLDATGHNITLDGGGGKVTLLAGVGSGGAGAGTYVTLSLKNLTLTNSGDSAVAGSYCHVSASNCTFSNNHAQSGGGAVYNSGGLGVTTLRNCTLVNNQAAGSGGAVYSSFAVALSDCVFSGNAAIGPAGTSASMPSYNGGAVYTAAGGSTITNCAFVNNHLSGGAYSSVNGGAVRLGGTDSNTITSSTFTGNSATAGSNNYAHGGAIYCNTNAGSVLDLTNCTLANNSVTAVTAGFNGRGGGIYNGAGAVTLVNTIVAGNAADFPAANYDGVALNDGGHNICSDASCNFASASTSKNNTDPQLGSLVYTGGAPPTLSLLPGSPAIDAGDDGSAPTTDQRGASRQGAHSDIGAYERAVWQADAVAVGPDNHTRVLWNKSDGTVNVWSIDNSSRAVASLGIFPPNASWTARALAVGSDNITHVLWTTPSGQMKAWSITPAGAVTSTSVNGPFGTWRAQNLAVGSDNNMRVLWTTPGGMMSLWNLDAAGHVVSSPAYGPFAGWQAVGIGTGSDVQTRVMWTTSGGQMNLWSLDSGGNAVGSTGVYGPFGDWQAVAFGNGGALNPVLWVTSGGQMSAWGVNSGGNVLTSTPVYGPYTGWAATAICGGVDGNTRVAWSSLTGALNLWSIDPASGNVLASSAYGPF